MVVITEITDCDIRVISGSWGLGADGRWVFIANPSNSVRRLSIHEGEKVAIVKEAVRSAF